MELSIIILNYNHKNLLKNCLKSLQEASIKSSYELIITDNGSNDQSQEFLSQLKKGNSEIKVIFNSKNLGYSRANNQAIKLAQGKYILILNPDIIVFPQSIDKLKEFLQENSQVGVVGPQLLNPDKSIQYSCCRFPNLLTPLLRRTFLGCRPWFKKELGHYLMFDFDHQQTREVDWLIGASLMIKKEVFEKVGLFDERYFAYFEDVDFCRRVREAGFKVIYFPQTQMIHFHQRLSADGSFIHSLFSKATWIHIKSALKYFWKWRKNKKVL
ncbi:MAG: glycosyltransferase family 2 protein [Patescibacteria group bacterium]|nr:glycosyltransferase family 2 protein [Patescibacteria group bacterium]